MSNHAGKPVSTSGHIIIRPIGLEDSELRMLKSLCAISSIAKGSRNRKYELADPGQAGHIYLVDAGKAEAYSRWSLANKAGQTAALLVADAGHELHSSDKVAHRPLIPSRLLAMLDELPLAEDV